jgi:hypothetical protein
MPDTTLARSNIDPPGMLDRRGWVRALKKRFQDSPAVFLIESLVKRAIDRPAAQEFEG